MSRTARSLIEVLENPSAAPEDQARALAELASNPRLAATPEDLARLDALRRRCAALIESARAERARILNELQEAAAARHFAATLTPEAGPIIDLQI